MTFGTAGLSRAKFHHRRRLTAISDIATAFASVSLEAAGAGIAAALWCGVAAADCARIGRDIWPPTADDCGLVTALIVFEASTTCEKPEQRNTNQGHL